MVNGEQSNWEQSSIIILRHGEPEPQGTPVFRGITDDELSKKGWRQMADAVNKMTEFDHIISSPLLRCYDFAQKLATDRALPLEKFDALKEINFGQWEGKSVQKLEAEYASQLKQFWENPVDNTPPDGEAVLDFQSRVIEFWEQYLVNNKGKNTLMITHGGVQKMILAGVLGMPVQAVHNIEVPYACCSKINVYYSDKEIIATLSSHLTQII